VTNVIIKIRLSQYFRVKYFKQKKHKMKIKIIYTLGLSVLLFGTSCNSNDGQKTTTENETTSDAKATVGQSGVQDDQSAKNVVQVAVGSKDHTTLVTAIKAGDLVDALSNAGPFTVFAPTNAAFDKLPAGTVEGLLKPESKDALVDILDSNYLDNIKNHYHNNTSNGI